MPAAACCGPLDAGWATEEPSSPGRAVDLGCGEGDNAIFLARHGFDVTGVDFAPAAIAKAKAKAKALQAGAALRYIPGRSRNS